MISGRQQRELGFADGLNMAPWRYFRPEHCMKEPLTTRLTLANPLGMHGEWTEGDEARGAPGEYT